MRTKRSIITVPCEEGELLIPAIHVYVGTLEAVLPPCSWCKQWSLVTIMEYVQLGFEDDKWTVICGCPECKNATVFEYRLVH